MLCQTDATTLPYKRESTAHAASVTHKFKNSFQPNTGEVSAIDLLKKVINLE
jgi:hypothetical protein